MDENWTWSALLNAGGYISGDQTAIRGSIHNHIPRENNTLTKSEHTFVGNQILMRGFRWEFMGYINTPAAVPDISFRFTVYDDPIPYNTLPMQSGSVIFDPDFQMTATWARWNMQTAKIRFQRTFKLGQSSTGQSVIKKKFYIPIQRKLTTQLEESLIANAFFGNAKEDNLYWVLEVFAPTMTNISSGLFAYVQTSVYFKDP